MSEARDFEMYKLLLEELREARRARRELSNTFTSLNLAGVGALGFLRLNLQAASQPELMVWLTVALVLTCIIWRTSNAYYTKLLAAKYSVLYRYEDRLGEKPMRDEYQDLGDRRWFKFFSLEQLMPVLFVLGYFVFLAYSLPWWASVLGPRPDWLDLVSFR
jgi:hypothetical protein